MTRTELERLAVVETKVDAISASVERIERRVDTILVTIGKGEGVLSFFARIVPWLALGLSALVALHMYAISLP